MSRKKLAAIAAVLIGGAVVVGTVEATVIDRLGAPEAYGAVTTAAYVAAFLAVISAFTRYDGPASERYRETPARHRAVDVGVAAVAAGLVGAVVASLALSVGVGTIEGAVGSLSYDFGPRDLAFVVGLFGGMAAFGARARDRSGRGRPSRS